MKERTKKYTLSVPLLLLLFSFPALSNGSEALSAAEGRSSPAIEYTRAEIMPGDRCLVSGLPLEEDDIAILVLGRRVPLKREALEIFLENPDTYFSALQPKGALFAEDIIRPKRISLGWFFFGAYVLVGLIFGALCAHEAIMRGLPPHRCFFYGLLINVFGYLLIRMERADGAPDIPSGLVKVPLTSRPNPCPYCGHQNHPTARRCSGCGADLVPKKISETKKAGIPS